VIHKAGNRVSWRAPCSVDSPPKAPQKEAQKCRFTHCWRLQRYWGLSRRICFPLCKTPPKDTAFVLTMYSTARRTIKKLKLKKWGSQFKARIKKFHSDANSKKSKNSSHFWAKKRRATRARDALRACADTFSTKWTSANAAVATRESSFGPDGPKRIKKSDPRRPPKSRPSLLFGHFLIPRRAVQ